MATIDIEQTHDFPIDKAKTVLRALIDDFQQKNQELVKDVAWEADGASALATGNGFSARFVVDENQASVSVDLNLMLRPFKKKIAARLERKLEEALCP